MATNMINWYEDKEKTMNTLFIKHRMRQLNKTQNVAAKEVGISVKHFSQIINNKANPTLKILKDIAKSLECDLPNLFESEEL